MISVSNINDILLMIMIDYEYYKLVKMTGNKRDKR